MKLQFRQFLKTRKPQVINNTVIITPSYWIMYCGIALPLPNSVSDKLFEFNYVKLKEETDSNELEFTQEGLDALKYS